MIKNIVFGFALLLAVVGIAVAPVHAADDLTAMVDSYKGKTDIDIRFVDQGIAGYRSSGIDIYADVMLFDEAGRPLNLTDAYVRLNVVTISTNSYNRGSMAFAAVFYRNHTYICSPEDAISVFKAGIEKKEMVIPVRRDDGVIELRATEVSILHIKARFSQFLYDGDQIYIRRFGDPVGVHILVYTEEGKQSRAVVEQYVYK